MPVRASTLLIADLHLDASRPDTVRAALNTFAAATRFDALWILGDLFEAWIGDDAGLADPLGERVATALAALAGTGTRVHLMLGNRDFLLGEAFARAAGATLHREDELIVTLAGTPVLLLHGDTLCTDDADYQRLRRQLRDPAWQAGFTALPIAERLRAARQLREASREAGGRKAQGIMDVTAATVHDRLRLAAAEHGASTMLHGHTHRPAVHDVALPPLADDHAVPSGSSRSPGSPGSSGLPGASGPTARRLVLGDWHADGGQGIVAGADELRPVRCPAGIRPPSPG